LIRRPYDQKKLGDKLVEQLINDQWINVPTKNMEIGKVGAAADLLMQKFFNKCANNLELNVDDQKYTMNIMPLENFTFKNNDVKVMVTVSEEAVGNILEDRNLSRKIYDEALQKYCIDDVHQSNFKIENNQLNLFDGMFQIMDLSKYNNKEFAQTFFTRENLNLLEKMYKDETEMGNFFLEIDTENMQKYIKNFENNVRQLEPELGLVEKAKRSLSKSFKSLFSSKEKDVSNKIEVNNSKPKVVPVKHDFKPLPNNKMPKETKNTNITKGMFDNIKNFKKMENPTTTQRIQSGTEEARERKNYLMHEGRIEMNSQKTHFTEELPDLPE
jgi:hypothetical protein